MLAENKRSFFRCVKDDISLTRYDIRLRRMIYFPFVKTWYNIRSLICRRHISSLAERYHTKGISPVPQRNGYHWGTLPYGVCLKGGFGCWRCLYTLHYSFNAWNWKVLVPHRFTLLSNPNPARLWAYRVLVPHRLTLRVQIKIFPNRRASDRTVCAIILCTLCTIKQHSVCCFLFLRFSRSIFSHAEPSVVHR